jgi:microcin C transport system permease protein
MFEYIIRRLLLILPTLFGITILFFIIINLAPGSPIEQKLQQIRFAGASMGEGGGGSAGGTSSRGDQGVSDEVLEALKKQYGFDKPMHVRYWIWLKNLMSLDFGESFVYEEPVIDVIISKFPVSLQFGIVSLFLSYLVCIPLGVGMAVKEGEKFDVIAGFVLMVMYAIPSFMLGILLIVFLAGGSFLDIFPIGELYSDEYDMLGFFGKIWDRIHHFILPLICYMIGSFTTLTLLMKNSLLDVLKLDYIRTARAKGLDERVIVLKHALRNALIPIVTGLGGFLSIFFAGSLLIEEIFQLDGMGLLGYSSVLSRDYNVLMGLLFIQSLLMLVGNLISDIAYVIVDPRIDFK